jgi:hypothetical protein
MLAADMRAREAKAVAQTIKQRRARLDLNAA